MKIFSFPILYIVRKLIECPSPFFCKGNQYFNLSVFYKLKLVKIMSRNFRDSGYYIPTGRGGGGALNMSGGRRGLSYVLKLSRQLLLIEKV